MTHARPTTRTTCPYCGVGCGVRAEVDDGRLVAVSGDIAHPANAGRLCVKGSALADTQVAHGRLLEPHVSGRPTTWAHALDRVAEAFRRALAEDGPGAVAMYLSGQLLTEDYYVANKLMKGFIGSGNVDTNSRLCMASAVTAHKRAFGEDVVPCEYSDLESCELLVLVGSNLAWAHPVLYQRVAARRARGELRVVVVDPRRTATCDIADLHLPLRPGADVALFNALLVHLCDTGVVDHAWMDAHTTGFEEAMAAARADARQAAAVCGLQGAELGLLFDWFAATPRTLTMFSQGVNQAESGTDKANAIINCHLATGRIGRPGCGPFSITGQPNAMGGREVGGMATTLAAHNDFSAEARDRVGRFWEAPCLARGEGLKAVDLFDAVADGSVRVLWIMGTNPVVSLPDADRVKAALERCPNVVVSDCVAETDTTACADILLPACGWGEKDGTVTNSERRISRQRAFLRPPGHARPDWWMVCQVAARLGHGNAFAYTGPDAIFREHAALSAFDNDGARQFDLGALATLDRNDYDALAPVQWPLRRGADGPVRPFADGRFATPDRRARLIPVRYRPPVQRPDVARPLVLNTGRLRDQWHTMTRTGSSPRLFGHSDVPTVALHPDDAARLTLAQGDLAEVSNDRGRLRGVVTIDQGQRPGSVFVPMHWNDRFSGLARVGVLFAPAVDPLSGQPESKHGAVAVRRYPVAGWARVAAQDPLSDDLLADLPFWTRLPDDAGWRYELAWEAAAHHPLDALADAVGHDNAVTFDCAATEDRRLLLEREGSAVLLAFAHPSRAALPPGDQIATWRDDPGVQAWRRLAGAAGANVDASRLVCTCFEVREAAILAAVVDGVANTRELGERLRCGTNCGSCLPELNALLASTRKPGLIMAGGG